ncbi:MAG: ATP-binding protein [Pirellulaceae bacterium]
MAFLRATTGLHVGDVSELKPGSLIIGRNPKRCDVVLDHTAVSREHACIELVDGLAYVEDLYSRNGVTVNGRLLQPGLAGRMRLFPRDRVKIASYEFVYGEDPVAAIYVAEQENAKPGILSTVNVASDSSRWGAHEAGDGRLQTILAIMEGLSNALELDRVLPKIIDSLFRIFRHAETGLILMHDDVSGDLEPAAFRSRSGEETEARVSRTLVRHVLESRSAVLSGDAMTDARFDSSRSVGEMRLRSIMCVPLIDGQGCMLGLIQLDATGPEHFGDGDLEVLAGVARHLAIVIENSRLHETAMEAQRAELEQRFQGLIEGSIQGILIHRRFRPLFVNEAWARLHGHTVEEVMQMETVLPLTAPDGRERAIGYEEARLRGEEVPARYESRGLRQDGSVIWLEKFVTTVEWDDGPAVQTAVVDVTDRKKAEEALHAARDELEKRVDVRTAELARSNRDLEQFAYSVSHDLQSPLRTVASYCQLLQKRYQGKLDDEADEFLTGAVDGTRRMRRLLDDLLSYSRVATQSHQFLPADATSVLKEALFNLQAAIDECHAEVTHDTLPSVVCDATQLMQIFQNLIGNAIRYRSERPPTIHIGCVEEPADWKFCVQDNGVGMDPRHGERIFQIFQRLYAEHEIPGSGIGLAICKRIVERHGGRIWVESQPNEGSVFFFTLPK